MEHTLAHRLEQLRAVIPEHVTLVAVSKNQSADNLLQVYHAGQRIFGENKAQELVKKAPLLPSDIQWHFIGHLQTNKVKAIIPWVKVIHSIDSAKLYREVVKEAGKEQKSIEVLLQFHIAEEVTKYGFSLDEAEALLADNGLKNAPYVKIVGVMGMATFTDDNEQIIKEFNLLKEIFHTLREKFFMANNSFRHLSMGMSDDYPLAIARGSTMVRIGSALFAS
jgi:PLP dependent protein